MVKKRISEQGKRKLISPFHTTGESIFTFQDKDIQKSDGYLGKNM